MKDQNNVKYDDDSEREKWNRALNLFIESVYKPDNELRSCAHNQHCYNELMEVRKCVLDYVHTLRWYQYLSTNTYLRFIAEMCENADIFYK